MSQSGKFIGIAVSNHSKSMEMEDTISKNRWSSKNQMSRRNILIHLVIVTLVESSAFSCNSGRADNLLDGTYVLDDYFGLYPNLGFKL